MSSTFVELRVTAAEEFIESISEPTPNTKFYLTFGKIDPWSNEANPDTSNTSVATFYDYWSNLVGGKRIVGSDFHHVIPRFDWESGQSFVAFDHMNPHIQMGNVPFYVMTSEYNVYKCLANNSGGVSTVEPSSISPSTVISTSDGYIWKYLYTISDAEQIRFTTNDYIPVKKLAIDDGSQQWQVQENAIDGGIHSIVIENGGDGYSNASNILMTVTGDGSGLLTTIQVDSESNSINAITVTDPGDSYTYATVNITGDTGTGAEARAIIAPPGGHGSNPLYELFGRFIMLNLKFKYDEDGVLPVSNDFRQIAILKDPLVYGTSNVATTPVFSQTTTIITVGSGDYHPDEIVFQGSQETPSFSGRVLSWNAETNELLLINTRGTPTGSLLLVGSQSYTVRSVSGFTPPDLKLNSGKLLYLDNIIPISRDPEQIEDIRLIIKM